MRALFRMMLLGTVAALSPVLLHTPALQAAPAESERQSGAFTTIKSAIPPSSHVSRQVLDLRQELLFRR